MKLCRNPRWQRTLRHRGLRKMALNSGRTRRSAKKGQKGRKTPSNRQAAINTAIRRNNVQISSANRAWTSEAPARRKYEILPKARGLTHERSTNCSIEIVFRFSSANSASGSESTFHVENKEILLKAAHLSLYTYGHVNNCPEHQELHLWNTTKSVAQQGCPPLRG